jgi:hypothetical protein
VGSLFAVVPHENISLYAGNVDKLLAGIAEIDSSIQGHWYQPHQNRKGAATQLLVLSI